MEYPVWPSWPWPCLQFHLAIDPVTFGHRSGHSWPKSAKSGHCWSFGHTYNTLTITCLVVSPMSWIYSVYWLFPAIRVRLIMICDCCRNQENINNIIKQVLQEISEIFFCWEEICQVCWSAGRYELWLGEREALRLGVIKSLPGHSTLSPSET